MGDRNLWFFKKKKKGGGGRRKKGWRLLPPLPWIQTNLQKKNTPFYNSARDTKCQKIFFFLRRSTTVELALMVGQEQDVHHVGVPMHLRPDETFKITSVLNLQDSQVVF